ncbi:MAG: histidinol-phosphate aminotransferase [Spirosomataceae bacterium]
MKIEQLVRPHLLKLKPYSSARDEFDGSDGVFLDANENPFGSVTSKPHNRYPDPHQREAKVKLAAIKRVQPKQIFLGNGSDEAIDLLIKVFCEPQKDAIMILPPTYGMYKVCADIQNVKVIEVPLTEEFQIDVSAVESKLTSKVKMLWLCSPNNPSGNLLDDTSVLQLIKNNPDVIVVVDEAYVDFGNAESFIGKINEFENLVVIQTFSKAWGMAGLRLGAAYSNEFIISVLNNIKYPYNLNQLTQEELVKALDSFEKLPEIISQINSNKNWLKTELTKLSCVEKIYPSDSNQLLVKFNQADELFEKLIRELVIIRNRTKVQLCEGCLRISIGTKSELETLIETIKKVTS